MNFANQMRMSYTASNKQNNERDAFKPQLDTQELNLMDNMQISSQIHEITTVKVNFARWQFDEER
jgi:hypothetical protein